MSSFSEEDRKVLIDRLNVLRQVCCPSTGLTVPSFKFKKKKDFNDYDFLDFGYPIHPSELKDIWQDRETLRDHDVDYIIAKGKKWFFNTKKICGDFYSKDGNKKVEVTFPFWMDAENIWRQPEAIDAMRKVLEKCSGHHFPTQQEALACFPKKLLRQIYDQNPSRPAIEDAVLEMMETLRKKIAEHLKNHHLNAILKDPGFLSYIQNTSFQGNPPDAHKVGTYFAQNKQAMYFLAQKFGVIKNAASMMYYEEMRDHPRHPDKVIPLPIDTHKTYRDFEKALGVDPKGASRAKTFKTFAENEDIVQHLADMSSILEILNFHSKPELKKKYKKAAYYQDLIQKGILTPDEAKLVAQKIKDCNNAAHLNYSRTKARKKVMDDTQLMGLAIELDERHNQQLQKIHRWAKESSHTI